MWLGLQAAAGQNPAKAFNDAEGTFEPRGAKAVCLPGIKRNRRPRRAGEMTKDFGQAATRDVERPHCAVLGRHGCLDRCCGPGSDSGYCQQRDFYRGRQTTTLEYLRHPNPPENDR
ncbi:hypothetical protein D3C76_1629160 [compost metagenome]